MPSNAQRGPSLAERLEALERTVQWYRRLAIASVIAVSAVLAMGQAGNQTPKMLVARGLNIVDPSGKTVVAVDGLKSGGRISLSNGKGVEVASLDALGETGSVLSLSDGRGHPRVTLAVYTDQAGLTLADSESRDRLSLDVNSVGASLELRGKDGIVVAELATAINDMPNLILMAPDSSYTASLGSLFGLQWGLNIARNVIAGSIDVTVDKDGAPRVELFDTEAKSRAILGVANLETTTTGATAKTAASSLVLFDKAGHVLWRTP